MKRSIIIFVVLSVFASALNYIIYPLFARILAPAEYVNITVSLSLFTQIATFLSSIIAITIGLSKDEHSKRTNEKIELLQAFLFKLFLGLSVIFLLVSPVIMEKVNTPVLFALPISLMMLFSIPISVISGYLNGKDQMIKLGLVALVSAGSQFTIGLTVSLLTHNGLATMLSMTIAQVITLVIIYAMFSKSQLPRTLESLKVSISTIRSKKMGSLIGYAAATSLGIMAISLVQIVDLFILQNLAHVDTKFYTDIYVISRVVFFAGMIFIWPFLGEISVDHHHFNRKPFGKVIGYFTVITIGAIGGLYLFGDQLIHALFGANYPLQLIQNVGILSVLYKFFLLVITATVLYFVVLRSYVAVWFSVVTSGLIFVFSELVSKNSDMQTVLVGLNLLAGILAIIGVVLLVSTPIQKTKR